MTSLALMFGAAGSLVRIYLSPAENPRGLVSLERGPGCFIVMLN